MYELKEKTNRIGTKEYVLVVKGTRRVYNSSYDKAVSERVLGVINEYASKTAQVISMIEGKVTLPKIRKLLPFDVPSWYAKDHLRLTRGY